MITTHLKHSSKMTSSLSLRFLLDSHMEVLYIRLGLMNTIKKWIISSIFYEISFTTRVTHSKLLGSSYNFFRYQQNYQVTSPVCWNMVFSSYRFHQFVHFVFFVWLPFFMFSSALIVLLILVLHFVSSSPSQLLVSRTLFFYVLHCRITVTTEATLVHGVILCYPTKLVL